MAYFAASVDSPETLEEFSDKLDLDYPLLSDDEGKVAGAFGVLSPTMNLARRWTYYIGKDGTILHIDKDVKPATAGGDIAARLEELDIPRAE